jgi:hypothetical protein
VLSDVTWPLSLLSAGKLSDSLWSNQSADSHQLRSKSWINPWTRSFRDYNVGQLSTKSIVSLGVLFLTISSNNVLASSFSSLDLDGNSAKTLLSNPQEYLAEVSREEADRIRAILLPAYRRGFRIIFIIGASLAAFAFVLAFFLMPQVELNRPDDQKLKEEAQKAHEEKKVKKKGCA